MTYSKLLHQLSITQLRQELRDRDLKPFGSKERLTARLRQALIEEDEDPETYQFEVEPGIGDVMCKIQECGDEFKEQFTEQLNTIRIMMRNMSRDIMLNVDESVLEVEEQIDQSDHMVWQPKEGIDSFVKGQLPGQDCGCTNSGDIGAGDWSAVCDCVVGKSDGGDFQGEERDNDCCDDLTGIYRIERKEMNEEAEVCFVPETFVLDLATASTSMSRTDQDNVWSASKLVTMDLKDLCLSAGAHERNSKLDNCIQMFSINCTCGASHRECGCQENHQQGLRTSAIIIDIGMDECQSAQSKSELSRGRHLPLELEETYLMDVRLLPEDECGISDFVCNVVACEPVASMRVVCREGLLKRRVRSTTVLTKTVLDTISLCVKRPRHRLNNSLVNWRKRKRHWRKTMRMALWGTPYLPPVAPTDRPPPELLKFSCSVSFRDEKC